MSVFRLFTEAEFKVEQFSGFAHSIINMFFTEPRKVIEVVVAEIIETFVFPAIVENYMFIHEPLLVAAMPFSEQP